MRVNDPNIIDQYPSNCLILPDFAMVRTKDHLMPGSICAYCNTDIFFTVETFRLGLLSLFINIWQELPRAHDITDPAWIAQLVRPKEIEQPRQERDLACAKWQPGYNRDRVRMLHNNW